MSLGRLALAAAMALVALGVSYLWFMAPRDNPVRQALVRAIGVVYPIERPFVFVDYFPSANAERIEADCEARALRCLGLDLAQAFPPGHLVTTVDSPLDETEFRGLAWHLSGTLVPLGWLGGDYVPFADLMNSARVYDQLPNCVIVVRGELARLSGLAGLPRVGVVVFCSWTEEADTVAAQFADERVQCVVVEVPWTRDRRSDFVQREEATPVVMEDLARGTYVVFHRDGYPQELALYRRRLALYYEHGVTLR